jgi:hypothetical protein
VNGHRHPDPVIAGWLDDGPERLSGAIRGLVAERARATRQRHPSAIWRAATNDARWLLVAAAVVALLASLAIMSGSVPWRDLAPPTPTIGPVEPPPLEQGILETGRDPLAFEYVVLPDLALERHDASSADNERGWIAFTAGGPGPYGIPAPSGGSEAEPTKVPGARGVVVAVVTGARPHFNNDLPAGVDAASFIEGLRNNRHGFFTVGEVRAGRIGTLPALRADIQGQHLDIPHATKGSVLSVDFSPPSRVLVADHDGEIVLVQVWAATTADLEAWWAEAQPFLESIRFVDAPTSRAN